jgi:tight adherence protein B
MDPVILLYASGLLVALLIGVGIFLTISSQRSADEARMDAFVESGGDIEEIAASRKSVVTDWLSKKVEKTTWSDKVKKDLAQADVKIKPGEYILILVISIIVTAIFGYLIGTRSYLLGAAGGVLGFFLPGMYVQSQRSRRLIRFNDQLGDMLSLMVNGLRAGYSTLQAMESVAKEMPAPISEEFRRVVQEVTLGVSTEKALDNLVRRIPSDDLDLVVTAIKVQREVGGNLAEILDTISHTIRERVRIKGEIRVLTAQMKFSGIFLSLLPIFLFIAIYIINREYISILIDRESNTPFPCGYIAIALAIVLIIVGYLVMNRFTKIEV